jgi:hypothetical protein
MKHSDIYIEDQLKDTLQRDVQFIVNGKALREGKLIMYNMKDFYVSFVLITKKEQTKTYDIPLPYRVIIEPTGITFDYRLIHIHHKSSNIKRLVESISKSIGKKSKLYDNTLTIKYNT